MLVLANSTFYLSLAGEGWLFFKRPPRAGAVPTQKDRPMISQIKTPVKQSQAPASHAKFLCLLPLIRQHARFAFRKVRDELKEDLIAEVIANSFSAFSRLAQRGREDLAYATPLAQYAIRQVHSGRRVGGSLGSRDILSQRVIARQGLVRQPMYWWDRETGAWCELLIEDHTAGPADTAAARIDFAAWRQRLPTRLRELVLALAHGETTNEAARRFRVSPARISQLRSSLKQSWEKFQGQPSCCLG
jgi:hypothetical protein